MTSVLASVVRATMPDGATRDVTNGTALGDLFPPALRPVAATFEGRLAGLDAPLLTDGRVGAVFADTLEGERVVRRTLGLVVLEAARRLWPNAPTTLGPPMGFGRPILLPPTLDRRTALVALRAETARVSAEHRPIRVTEWPTEEASRQLVRQGVTTTVPLLAFWRAPTVPLASCGDLHVLALGPFLPTTGHVAAFSIGERDGTLYLLYREEPTARRYETMQLLAVTAPPKRATDMTLAHERWLERMGIDGVGALTAASVTGDIDELVDVSEGFHERRVGEVAAEIAARPGVRVVCVAGPSAAGKTTFLRRLRTQLHVQGIGTALLSLDDYYRSRAETPRDDAGEPDFEAFEALDRELLHAQLDALLRGAEVRPARFDFERKVSEPTGGAPLRVAPGDVLLVEGLHGLHPALFAGLLPETSLFRVFVNASMSLALDALSRVNPSDVRLLRRIVRDRRRRATTASDNLARWASVRRGEKRHIFPHLAQADAVFDTSLVYEPCVLKVFAERYLLEVPRTDAHAATARRLLDVLDRFVAIYPERVPRTSLLREFIG